MAPVNLLVAGYPITVICDSEPFCTYLDRELMAFKGGTGGEPTLQIRLREQGDLPADDSRSEDNLSDFTRMTPVPGLELWLRHQATGDTLELDVLVCRRGECRYGDYGVLYPLLTNILFSLFLRQLKADGRADVLSIHACGAIRGGRSYLFAGKSGVGKSTLAARLMRMPWADVQGDDMIPLTDNGSGWQVHTSPLGGDIPRPDLVNASAPLAAIYFLSQAERTSLEPMTPPEAAVSLLGSLVLARSQENSTPRKMSDYEEETLQELMAEAAALAEEVPCFRLSLSLAEPDLEGVFRATESKVSAT